jgi:hypothetical protein
VLGERLVHAACTGGDPGARVGDVENLEQLLDRAVLAAGPVQGDEGGVGTLPGEALDQVGPGIE